MPQSELTLRPAGTHKAGKNHLSKVEPRFTVGLSPCVGKQVKGYAETVGLSMSKAIAALVRLGLEGKENRKQEFFKKLKENLAGDEPQQQDRLVDEFRTLILGVEECPGFGGSDS